MWKTFDVDSKDVKLEKCEKFKFHSWNFTVEISHRVGYFDFAKKLSQLSELSQLKPIMINHTSIYILPA